MANLGFKKKENTNKQTNIIIPSSSLKSNDLVFFVQYIVFARTLLPMNSLEVAHRTHSLASTGASSCVYSVMLTMFLKIRISYVEKIDFYM